MIFDNHWLYYLPQGLVCLGVLGMLISDYTNLGERHRLTVTIGQLSVLTAILAAFSRPLFGLSQEEIPFGVKFDSLTTWVEITVYMGLLVHSVAAEKSHEIFLSARVDYFSFSMLQAVALTLMAGANSLALALEFMLLIHVLSALLVRVEIQARENTALALRWLATGFVLVALMFFILLMDEAPAMERFFRVYQERLTVWGLYLITSYFLGILPVGLWRARLLNKLSLPSLFWFMLVMPLPFFVFFLRYYNHLYAQGHLSVFSGNMVGSMSATDIFAVLTALSAIVGSLYALGSRTLRGFVIGALAVEWAHVFSAVVTLDSVTTASALIKGAMNILLWGAAGVSAGTFLNILATDRLIDWRGAAWRSTKDAALFSVALTTALSVPPFFGFLGSFFLWTALIRVEQTTLATVLAGASFVVGYAGIRFIRSLWTRAGVDLDLKPGPTLDPGLSLSTRWFAAIVLMFVFVLVARIDFWLALAATISRRVLGSG